MTDPAPGEVTLLLRQIAAGHGQAREQLAAVVYGELRRMAAQQLGPLRGSTLQPTALVHEAWLRIGDGEFGSRSHFLGVAGRAMRSVLVDYVRARRADKRGGGDANVPLDEAVAFFERDEVDILDLDTALAELERDDPTLVRWVEMRFFAGMSYAEIAAAEGCSESTVERGWRAARAHLAERLSEA